MKQGEEKPAEVKAETEFPSATFVVSIVAFVLCLVPILGLILALVAAVMLVMAVVKICKKQIVLKKKDKLIISSVLTVIALFFGIGMVGALFSGSGESKKVEQVYSELKQPDVNGLTVSEACSVLREAGWTIADVASNSTSTAKKSDCSDTKHRATKASFQTEKYYTFDGSPKKDFETVYLYFLDDTEEDNKKEEDKKEESSSPNSGSSSNSGSSNSSSNNSSSSSFNNSSNSSNSGSSSPSSSSSSNSSSSSSSSSTPTVSQSNALRSAKDYLAFMSFSREGLIDQLEFEKYSHADAVYAVDHCGANWNEQAAKSAKSYLEFMSFSREGLIDQLMFDKFTREQAIYGANSVGL